MKRTLKTVALALTVAAASTTAAMAGKSTTPNPVVPSSVVASTTAALAPGLTTGEVAGVGVGATSSSPYVNNVIGYFVWARRAGRAAAAAAAAETSQP